VADKPRQLLVVFRFKDYSVARLANLVPTLANVLAEMSSVKPELVFHSHARDLIGYAIVSKLGPERVRAAIESSGRLPASRPRGSAPFNVGSDTVMVLEMSDRAIFDHGATPAGGQSPR
jgi:hypothetical protein